MIRDILSISLLLLLLSCTVLFKLFAGGVSLGLDVRQSPSELIKPPGDKVQISCSHDRTDYRECSNQKDRKWRKTLVCVASGFYPDHVSVSWQVDPPAVSSSGVATDSSALRGDKTYRISSRLRVSASDWFTEGRKFTCRKYLKTTQAAKLSYVVFIVKSSVYGAGVAFLLWRLQKSSVFKKQSSPPQCVSLPEPPPPPPPQRVAGAAGAAEAGVIRVGAESGVDDQIAVPSSAGVTLFRIKLPSDDFRTRRPSGRTGTPFLEREEGGRGGRERREGEEDSHRDQPMFTLSPETTQGSRAVLPSGTWMLFGAVVIFSCSVLCSSCCSEEAVQIGVEVGQRDVFTESGLKHPIKHRVCLGLDVRQSPSELIKPPGDKVQISCSHDRTDYRECSNQKDRKWRKTLVCVASGFYPDHVSVSWQVDPPAVSSSGVATDSSALRGDKTYRISSRLRVSASDWFTEGRKFTCRKYLKTTQAAKLSYVVFIVKSSVYGAGVAFLLWRLQVEALLCREQRQEVVTEQQI
ncbi:hypothetical protein F7725_008532 [Dissostichus mawsoni]|uniref:Ig-like domain-containing protein n=1 Tax=Dissostichus mawsoni TaxID=36200 RepID=A0A7J5Y9F1_DISMA|nr:hypothetical protein F7725_008532 [Dissostichus mawsoni]